MKSERQRYLVLYHVSADILAKTVSNALADGYELAGPAFVLPIRDGTMICQPVIAQDTTVLASSILRVMIDLQEWAHTMGEWEAPAWTALEGMIDTLQFVGVEPTPREQANEE